jgi:hypothetical protein
MRRLELNSPGGHSRKAAPGGITAEGRTVFAVNEARAFSALSSRPAIRKIPSIAGHERGRDGIRPVYGHRLEHPADLPPRCISRALSLLTAHKEIPSAQDAEIPAGGSIMVSTPCGSARSGTGAANGRAVREVRRRTPRSGGVPARTGRVNPGKTDAQGRESAYAAA